MPVLFYSVIGSYKLQLFSSDSDTKCNICGSLQHSTDQCTGGQESVPGRHTVENLAARTHIYKSWLTEIFAIDFLSSSSSSVLQKTISANFSRIQ